MKPAPPKRAIRFLQWFCREEYLEEVEGNLTEIFEKEYSDSPKRARRSFYWNVLKHFRPEFLRKPKQKLIRQTMIIHNLTISYRNFARYKSSFMINLIGMSTGLACVLLISLWVYDEVTIDRFHSDRLYQVLENVDQGGGVITRSSTSGPMSATLATEFPEVEMAATTTVKWNSEGVLTMGEKDVKASGAWADINFFRMFNFPAVQGDASTVLKDKSGMVITEGLAIKLFGSTENVMGKTVELNHKVPYQISGVIKDFPRTSTIQVEYLLSFDR